MRRFRSRFWSDNFLLCDMSLSALEVRYVALLQAGFKDVIAEMARDRISGPLISLPRGEGGFARVNGRALEMNAAILLPWARMGRPTTFTSVVRAFSALDAMHLHKLSGCSMKQSQRDWARDEADKLLMLDAHMRALYFRSPTSRSALIDNLKAQMRKPAPDDGSDSDSLPAYPGHAGPELSSDEPDRPAAPTPELSSDEPDRPAAPTPEPDGRSASSTPSAPAPPTVCAATRLCSAAVFPARLLCTSCSRAL